MSRDRGGPKERSVFETAFRDGAAGAAGLKRTNESEGDATARSAEDIPDNLLRTGCFRGHAIVKKSGKSGTFLLRLAFLRRACFRVQHRERRAASRPKPSNAFRDEHTFLVCLLSSSDFRPSQREAKRLLLFAATTNPRCPTHSPCRVQLAHAFLSDLWSRTATSPRFDFCETSFAKRVRSGESACLHGPQLFFLMYACFLLALLPHKTDPNLESSRTKFLFKIAFFALRRRQASSCKAGTCGTVSTNSIECTRRSCETEGARHGFDHFEE